MSRRFVAFLLLSLSLAVSAFAEPLVAGSRAAAGRVGAFMEILEDPEGSLGLDEARVGDFRPGTVSTPNFGWSTSAFWFRLRIEDPRPAGSRDLVLDIGWPLFDELEFWCLDPASGAVLKRGRSGDSLPPGGEDYTTVHVAFILPRAPAVEVYLRVRGVDTIQLPLRVLEEGEFFKEGLLRALAWGFFLGSAGLMLVYALFMALFLRDRVYLVYSGHLGAMILFALAYSGIGYTWIWGAWPAIQNPALPFSMALLYLASAAFSRAFLDVDEKNPALAPWFTVLELASAAGAVASLFLPPLVMGVALNLVVFYGVPVIVLASVAAIRRGEVPARYFLAAWASYLAGGSLLVLKDFRLLPSTPLTDLAIHWGLALQVFLFLLAVADRMFRIKQEREQYMADYLREQERALALQRAENAEAQRRLRITEIYTRKSIVEAIRAGEDPTTYLPASRQLTVLFSDIRDFTGIAEKLDPQETIGLLNSYFDAMNEAIISQRGEIDKLIGDCIMALFSDPDDSLRAALRMRGKLREINETRGGAIRIECGIGINHGGVLLGNIGSATKMDFTVIGDIVNSASRLEALTKHYGLPIVVSEELLAALEGSYRTRFVDAVLVKGKRQPMRIHEVYDMDKDEIAGLKARQAPDLEEAWRLYEAGRFAEAAALYERLVADAGPHAYRSDRCADPLLDFYLKRARLLGLRRETGNLGEWSGVFEFTEK